MSWFNFGKKAKKKEIETKEQTKKEEHAKEELANETPEKDADGTIKEPVSNDSKKADQKLPEDKNEASEDIYEHGLAKSRSTFGKKLNSLFANFRSVDDEFFENLEDTLIESDVGVSSAMELSDELKDEVKEKNVKKPNEIKKVIVDKMISLYGNQSSDDNQVRLADDGLSVILFVGVNGVGKTTTIGKMAHNYKQAGKKVLLAAADTFRAGAIEQLNEWAKKDGVDIVKKEAGSDPASVVYEALDKAKKENYDVLFVDTAGRLQNKVNLMNELKKINKIIQREVPDGPQETLLVLDATTGQNALNQAKMFNEVSDISGIVLTKLDGTAKGGIVLAIKNQLKIPVKLVGLGESADDLAEFDPQRFINGLFAGLID